MVKRIAYLLLLAMQCLMITCSKRTGKLVYRPYGFKMCGQLCQDTLYAFTFEMLTLSCRRISADDSESGDDSFVCRSEMLGLDVCHRDSEDHPPTVPHASTDGPHTGELVLNPGYCLYQASEDGNLCIVQYILSQGMADINFRGWSGRTSVMAAASKGQMVVFDFLVSQGCDLSYIDYDNDSVLHVACMSGSFDIVRKLIVSHKYDLEIRGMYGRTPVMLAVYFGHTHLWKFFIDKGSILTVVDAEDNNILHLASGCGHVDLVKYILSLKIFHIDTRGYNGRTPVMFAVYRGHREMVQFLASIGSNLTLLDSEENNLLHIACVGGDVDMVEYILSRMTFDINVRGEVGRTPVMLAAFYGHRDVLEFFMSKDCKLTLFDNEGSNILHMVCMRGHVDIMTYLMKLGVDKGKRNQKNKFGLTPVMLAMSNGHSGVVALLRTQI